jgi:hypothetical protein
MTLQCAFTTPPAAGATSTLRWVTGSCALLTSSTGFVVLDAILALSPQPKFIKFLGDFMYDDNRDVNDPAYLVDIDADTFKQKRSTRYNTRAFAKYATPASLMAAMPFVSVPDDHDLYNDAHWDTAFASRTYDQIHTDMRTVWKELQPYPTSIDNTGTVIAFEHQWGDIRFLTTDTRAQRRYTTGTPTLFGHNSGHEHVDHFTQVCNRITAAGADSTVNTLVVEVTCTVDGGNDGFGLYATAERLALYDHMRSVQVATGLRIVVSTGDKHLSAMDDGTNTDFSTSGMKKYIFAVDSPWASTALTTGTYSWAGSSAKHSTSDNYLGVWDRDTSGQITKTIYDCSSGSAVQVGQYSTTSLTAGKW